MTSPTKSASVRLYNIRYSRIILKLEISLILITFVSLVFLREELWLFPCLILNTLLTFIFLSSFSIITQFPKRLVFEFRTAPDRLIWYDSTGESSFLLQDVKVRMTRWFVMLKLVNSAKQWNGVLLQDSFVDMSHYTSFRRQLLLKKREDMHVS